MNIIVYLALGFGCGLVTSFYLVTRNKQTIVESKLGQEAVNVIDQVVEDQIPKVIQSISEEIKKNK